tara:strand:- start:113 stop:547 length:435 start_codon:yes stop_codon:yes gene_type:complete
LKIDIINYSDLSKDQLFDLIKLRINVFVVEQNCPYQELDEIDLISNHVIGSNNNEIVALGRLYKKEDSIHIGRIAVKKEFRNLGYARELMQFTLNFLKLNYPTLGIELSAQEYLLNFYISLGFSTIGEMYLEDGIPHVKMVYFS